MSRNSRATTPIALPSRDDPLVGALSEPMGGPAGAHAVPARRWWTPVRIALAVACAVLALGVIADLPCRDDGWATRSDESMWTDLCYSDVPFLYRERGFADGALPYRDAALEYPVLTGLVMHGSAYLARATSDSDTAIAGSVRFYDVTAMILGIAALVVVAATAWTVRRRPWDALLVAASPVLLLMATINWDLMAAAAVSLAILAWTRRHDVLTGVFIGLGAAVKLYPMLLLGPLLLVALRSPDRRLDLARYGIVLGTAIASWSAVNLAVYVWAPSGWLTFFTFNADRGPEFGSVWYAIWLQTAGTWAENLNVYVAVAAAVLLVAIVVLALRAPEPPRLAQLAFLAVAAFVLVNKVWSPQYALWLLPLAALARPRWRDIAIWQAGEVVYFVAVWWHLAGITAGADLISHQQYTWAVAVRVACLAWLIAVVVRDILVSEHDPVRPYLETSVVRR